MEAARLPIGPSGRKCNCRSGFWGGFWDWDWSDCANAGRESARIENAHKASIAPRHFRNTFVLRVKFCGMRRYFDKPHAPRLRYISRSNAKRNGKLNLRV